MSHFGDFMDGVPVKISEKYKKPPKIELPHSVIECPIRAQNIVENVRYSSDFERNVLAKLKELRSIKETKKNERRHRLQLLEEAKQKKLDAIAAAEEEERLKQLSVSEVSYPSTEEISALSPDEKVDKNCDTNVDTTPETVTADVNIIPPCTTSEPQLNILQPIQIKSNYEGSLLDDPDPLETFKMNVKINKIHYNHNVDKLTFRDFENDTSSPFDNVELNTINDMELLAQVLQSQRESATSCHPQSYIQDQSYVIPNCASQAQMELPYIQHTYLEQPIQGPSVMCSPQNYPDGYYIQENDAVYAPNNEYYIPNNPFNIEQSYYNNQLSSTLAEASQVSNGSQSYIPQPYYYQYQPPVQCQPQDTTYVQNHVDKESVPSQNNVKSKSRSVPDIVQELNEELEKLKTSDRSYNTSPALELVSQPSSSTEKKIQKRRRKSEQMPNPYSKLVPSCQEVCQKIHAMGFPIDRVARVCTLVGNNDKKIIECLLILGEMMDLGFSETKVSEALLKHQFNREKVLDELVS